MGAVHGVYLKYVVLSVASGLSAVSFRAPTPEGQWLPPLNIHPATMLLWYVCLTNAAFAILFQLKWGMGLLGKNPSTGQIPWWSYALWAGFHLPTAVYTFVHNEVSKLYGIPVASQVAKRYWIGGRYSYQLKDMKWAAVVDLTCEFPEGCMRYTAKYLLLPTWDGVPPDVDDLEVAAQFGVDAAQSGDVLVHCAHGRGRSTCVMCAVLVTAGITSTWQDALKVCQAARPAVRLNARMRATLSEWQAKYRGGPRSGAIARRPSEGL